MVRDWTILRREMEADGRIFKVDKKTVRSPRTGRDMEVKAIRLRGTAVSEPSRRAEGTLR